MDKDTKLEIIIVDDSKDDHFFIKEALRDFKNISFRSFYDGEEFLRYINDRKGDLYPKYPDIVILDINMPKLTGFEVFEKVKKHELSWSVKFFILTTGLSDADKENSRRLELDYYYKPFSVKKYNDLLQEIIGGLL